jgi:hypothetical protein
MVTAPACSAQPIFRLPGAAPPRLPAGWSVRGAALMTFLSYSRLSPTLWWPGATPPGTRLRGL